MGVGGWGVGGGFRNVTRSIHEEEQQQRISLDIR